MFIDTYKQEKNINKFHAIAEFTDEYGGTYFNPVRVGGYKTEKGAIKALSNKVGHVVALTQGKNVTVYVKPYKNQEGVNVSH